MAAAAAARRWRRRRRPRRPRRPTTAEPRGALPCTSGEATRANGGQPAARSEHLQPLRHRNAPAPSHTTLLLTHHPPPRALSPAPKPRHPDPRLHADPHADPHPRPLARWATPPDASTKSRPCFRSAHYLRSALRLLGVLRRRGGTAARHGTARLLVASDSGAAVAELAQLAAAEGLRVVAVQSDRGEAWGGAAEGAALGLKREAALEHFIERRNGRGLVDRPCYLLPTTRYSRLTAHFSTTCQARRLRVALCRPATAAHGRRLRRRRPMRKQPPRGFGQFALQLQHAPPEPDRAQGGLEPRSASANWPRYSGWRAIPALVSTYRHRRLVDLPPCAARHQRRGGRAAALRAARQATRAALVRVTPPTPAGGWERNLRFVPHASPKAKLQYKLSVRICGFVCRICGRLSP